MGDKVRSFTDLQAWRDGHKLVLETYQETKHFPSEEAFGLTSQMRRCAVSITSNLAEGFSRTSKKEKMQFYATAQASLTELQNQLLIARDVGYVKPERFQELAAQSVLASKLIHGLFKSAQTR